ncbi:hypothetical protein K7432_014679 [Basidiobolus ranarum]|uniref:Cyclin n=1 Tax=Basidiobolus ranarum TaxID=34480 RepID=A0ABR2WHC4_9FUNG
MTPLELFSTAHVGFVPRIATFATNMVTHMWHRKVESSQLDIRFRASIEQVLLNSGASPSVLLLALKYIQRVTKNTQIQITGFERHMFVVAIILAHKMLEDDTFTNTSWSRIYGINFSELNTFEHSFFFSIGFDLFVSEIEFTQWLLYAEQYLRHSKQDNGIAPAQGTVNITSNSKDSECMTKSWWGYPSTYSDKHRRTPSSVV